VTNLVETTTTVDGLSGYTCDVAGKEARSLGLFRGTRIARVVVRWGLDKKPAETQVLEPGEKFPDLEAWNEALPRSEWVQGMNGPQGPWQAQQIVYFLDPKKMAVFHWIDGSVGGSIAIREAVDSTKAMRRFRPGAAPVVELSNKFMNTKFGGRQRPHLNIVNWATMPGEEPQAAALPAPVKPVTVDEEMNDAIGF
jgi:hypothetical protein